MAGDFIRQDGSEFVVYSEIGEAEIGRFAKKSDAEAFLKITEAAKQKRAAGRTDGKRVAFRQDFARGGVDCRLVADGVRPAPVGVRISGHMSRTGLYEYRTASGGVWRELHTDEEVFSEKSLASFRDVPITEMHPEGGWVDPTNAMAYMRGHVSEMPKRDGQFVAVETVIMDAGLIGRIARRERGELSPGYTIVVDETPGEFEGMPYHAVAREIEGNHLAVGMNSDWARGGRETRLHTDGGSGMKITIDGVEQELTEAGVLALLEKREKAAKEAQAKVDAAEAAAKKLADEVTALKAPGSIDAAVKAELEVARAVDLLPEAQRQALDGKSREERETAVIHAAFPEHKLDGMSAETRAQLFVLAAAQVRKADGALYALRGAIVDGQRGDSGGHVSYAAADIEAKRAMNTPVKG